MKRIFAFMVLMFMFITCGPTKHVKTWRDIGTDGTMIEIFDEKITYDEFVKICRKDTISTDLEYWMEMDFFHEDRKITKQWLYIKDTDTNRVYVLTMKPDSSYFLNIRNVIIEEIKTE